MSDRPGRSDPTATTHPASSEGHADPAGPATPDGLTQAWARPVDEVLEALDVSPELGLKAAEVQRRREQYGENALQTARRTSAWTILVSQFRNLIVLLLAVAAVVSFLSDQIMEGYAVVVVILINAAIGFFTEIRAVRSMEALEQLGTQNATVRREGHAQEVPAQELVPGDVLLLEAGQVVTADARLLEASRLQVDESILTGESVPVGKSVGEVAPEAEVPERRNMVFRGTALTRGAAEAIVTATGLQTEVGQVTQLVAEAEQEQTPLEQRLNQLGQRLVWVTLGIAVAVIGLGLLQGRETMLMIRTGLALAVATIPEGLPIVATAALARGMWRMAQHDALVSRLSAVETLGATSVICADKTGTLTENRMTLQQIACDSGEYSLTGGPLEAEGEFRGPDQQPSRPEDHPALAEAIRIGVLCNTAELHREEGAEEFTGTGDPMEVALLVAGEKAGVSRAKLIEDWPEVRQEAFDPEQKMMATYHQREGDVLVAVKGAPEAVFAICRAVMTADGEQPFDEAARREWEQRNEDLAGQGLRLLALARRTVPQAKAPPYEDLVLVGLAGLLDPPREEVRQALEQARQAGVRVVMLTGDQPLTAREVARSVGLTVDDRQPVLTGRDLRPPQELTEEDRRQYLRTNIFARVSPRQKLDLIQLYQDHGLIVAMTGDGVNDAPALRKADIGVAMGQRGTQVAREAAAMVLLDDSFNTIVFAIEQGRIIYSNIRKFVLYLLSCNMAEVMVVGLASLVNAPLPILPLQILFLNLVTDVLPALALGAGEGNEQMMRQPPRAPGEPVLARRHWLRVGVYGFAITVAVLAALALALLWLRLPERTAVTVSFLTLALAQLWHVFNMRDPETSVWRNDITRNRYVWGAVALCLVLTIGAVYVGPVAEVLKLEPPPALAWLILVPLSLLPLVAGQMLKPWERRQDRSAARRGIDEEEREADE